MTRRQKVMLLTGLGYAMCFLIGWWLADLTRAWL